MERADWFGIAFILTLAYALMNRSSSHEATVMASDALTCPKCGSTRTTMKDGRFRCLKCGYGDKVMSVGAAKRAYCKPGMPGCD